MNVIDQIGLLNSQIKDLEAKRDNLLAGLGDLKVGDRQAGERYVLEVTPNKRFDAATAERVLSKAKFNKILKQVPDSALARKALTGEEYEACQKLIGIKRNIKEYADA